MQERTLRGAIEYLVSHGCRVLTQTEQSAQLVKPKVFSFWWCILAFGIFYVPYYLAKQDETVYLREEDGVLKSRAGGG